MTDSGVSGAVREPCSLSQHRTSDLDTSNDHYTNTMSDQRSLLATDQQQKQRIAQYKETRRKELAAQFASLAHHATPEARVRTTPLTTPVTKASVRTKPDATAPTEASVRTTPLATPEVRVRTTPEARMRTTPLATPEARVQTTLTSHLRAKDRLAATSKPDQSNASLKPSATRTSPQSTLLTSSPLPSVRKLSAKTTSTLGTSSRDNVSPARSVDSLGSTGGLKRLTKSVKVSPRRGSKEGVSPARSVDSLGSTGSLKRLTKNVNDSPLQRRSSRDKISPLRSTGSQQRPKVVSVATKSKKLTLPATETSTRRKQQVAAPCVEARDKSTRISPLNREIESDGADVADQWGASVGLASTDQARGLNPSPPLTDLSSRVDMLTSVTRRAVAQLEERFMATSDVTRSQNTTSVSHNVNKPYDVTTSDDVTKPYDVTTSHDVNKPSERLPMRTTTLSVRSEVGCDTLNESSRNKTETEESSVEKRAEEGERARDPEKRAEEGERARDPVKRAEEGERARDPEKRAEEGERVRDPVKRAEEGERERDPVSILKRKSSREDSHVTFSVSPEETTLKERRPSILKKHSSLDEAEISRRRSCSPVVVDSRPILKRRSSLEEPGQRRGNSPEPQSILKRRESREEVIQEHESILKSRKNSVPSPPPHTSIATSVLAAAQAKMAASLDESANESAPRPILKKKAEGEDERPKKTILKTSRKSSEDEDVSVAWDEDGDSVVRRRALSPVRTQPRPARPLSVADRISQMEHDMREKDNLRGQNTDLQGPPSSTASPDRESAAMASAAQMKAVAEEAAAMRRRREKRGADARRARQTQPVTTAEVEQATAMAEEANEDAASTMTLAERVKFFNRRALETSAPETSSLETSTMHKTTSRSRGFRFKTQPVTLEELGTAQCMANDNVTHTDRGGVVNVCYSDNTPLALKSILKAGTPHSGPQKPEPELTLPLRSVLKKETSPEQAGSLPDRSILKTDHQSSSGSSSGEEEEEEEEEGRGPDLSEMLLNVSKERSTEQEKENQEEAKKVLNRELERKLLSKKLIEEFNQSRRPRTNGNSNTSNKDGINVLQTLDLSTKRLNSSKQSESRLKSSKSSGDVPCYKSDTASDSDVNTVSGEVDRSEVRKASADDTLSEGESSGGREVKKIIKNEAVARRRQAAINKQRVDLPKSPSLSHVAHTTPLFSGGLKRSMTQPMEPEDGREIRETSSIAERLAALKKNQDLGWQKRLPKLKAEDDLSVISTQLISTAASRSESRSESRTESRSESRTESLNDSELNVEIRRSESESLVADRRERLETASQGWKKRVEPTDAVNFSVAGRMRDVQSELISSPLLPLASERQKKTPRPNRFRSKTGASSDAKSNPVSPQKESRDSFRFQRSASAPSGDETNGVTASAKVSVPRADNETFSSFFATVLASTNHVTDADTTPVTIHTADLDLLAAPRHLLGQRRTVKMQGRKFRGSRNPVKTLAMRTDLCEEYEQVMSGVAEREMKRLQLDKLAQNSHLAVEALAGLASSEDFTSVSLKKAAVSPYAVAMLPFKELMLLHVKGRRHVQTRLVEPCVASINSGDSYVLVTPHDVYNWLGAYSNVIERSRSAEIASLIAQRKDLGCSACNVTTIAEGKSTCSRDKMAAFWSLLSADVDTTPTQAGHPDEDELYEASLVDTNMVYEVSEQELLPLADYWGALPRIDMLNPAKVLVFDFGCELYVWCGKNATHDARKAGTSLGTQLWNEGYDYSECDINPVTASTQLGARVADTSTRAGPRPEWGLCAKANQHMETVLFREKFSDWPDFSRVIRAGGKGGKERGNSEGGSLEVRPCDAQLMWDTVLPDPDLELEGSNVGRGVEHLDPETCRVFEVATHGVKVWRVEEFEHTVLPSKDIGRFYAGDSYVVRWSYSMTVAGRELGGLPSRHLATTGRERCAYFCWQGAEASINEQGAAALITVELDKEKGAQVRAVQGAEPPAFLNLFQGKMVVHSGKQNQEQADAWRLYMCRGERPNEASLVQVPCSSRQLRSRASLALLSPGGEVTVWHGAASAEHTRAICLAAARHLATTDHVRQVVEGGEPGDVIAALEGANRHLYHSLVDQSQHTTRMFHLCSNTGSFLATEVGGAYRDSSVPVAFPFLQQELYSVSQPALFLVDNGEQLWLWQGWWPEREGREEASDATGSGYVRWQAERRAAMQTVMDYWSASQRAGPPRAYLVSAGLEPLSFTNLFPLWVDSDETAEANIRDGRTGEVSRVCDELARLTRATYPASVLLQRPLPDGVDPTRLELYLDPEHFQDLLGMTKDEFDQLPVWKQTKVKKEAGFF